LTAYSESTGDTEMLLVAVVLWEGGVFQRPGFAQGFIYVECFHVGWWRTRKVRSCI